jgi:rhamnosyltransferase
MKKICVLLSTYNGEKFLAAQVDSLLCQKGVEIIVLVRDDGSKDDTVSILESYAKKEERFSFYNGQNIGPAQSFFDLIKNSPDADYYAFCDQDDVWDEDKLERAIEFLEKEDNTKPNLYYSNLRIVDQKLNFYRLSHSTPLVQESKYSALTENMATGCTVVFNDIAANIARRAMPEYCSMHDTWMYLICKFFGKVVYDFTAHISYRQHGNNVVGTYLEKKTLKLYVARIKRLFNRKLQPRYNNAINFCNAFSDVLSEADLIKVKKIVDYKDSLKNRLKLLFDREIYASSKSRDLRYRVLIIFGIV